MGRRGRGFHNARRWLWLLVVAAAPGALAPACTGRDPEAASTGNLEVKPRPVQGTVLIARTTYTIADGNGQRLRFTAPATPAFYTWTELLPAPVSGLRMEQGVLVVAPAPTGLVCAAPPSPRASHDATDQLQACIAATPPHTALELPPGRYLVSRPLRADRPITIRTLGVREDAARCATTNQAGGPGPACAEIAAAPAFHDPGGFLTSLQPNSDLALDHLVIDGNRAQRLGGAAADHCRAGDNQYGVNADIRGCAGCRVTGSVFEGALCGTGLHVWNVDVVGSLFARNGVHTPDSLWADGLTVGRCDGARVINNRFEDNTDVDLIFGSGASCAGRDNVIRHGADNASGSFVALSIFTWYTTGPYFGADIAFNDIDCGGQCGIGLQLGSDQALGPYFTFIEGGAVHDNRVRGAHQGVAVDSARGVAFYDNVVTESGGVHTTSCGSQAMGAYDVSPASALDRSRDTVPDGAYATREWDWCTPNWFGAPPPVRALVGDFDGDGGGDRLEIFPGDTGWYVSIGAQRWLAGWGGGNLHLVGDFDGDRLDDVLVFLGPGAGNVWHVAFSTGDAFAAVPFALTGERLDPRSCAIDVDGDGRLEVLNEATGRCARWDGGAHRFVVSPCPGLSCDTPFNPNAHPATASALLYGSFDSGALDARRDALAIDQDNVTWTVTRGRAPWLFRYEDWHETLVGDFDGDGRDDVLLVPSAEDVWRLARSTGQRFDVYDQALVGHGPYGVMCVRDVDHDGRDEVLWHGPTQNFRADFDPATATFTVTPIQFACALP